MISFDEYNVLLSTLRNEGYEYAVVYDDGRNRSAEAFSGRESAFERQKELSSVGLWSASFELRDMNLVSYLQGYLFKKKRSAA